MPQNEKCKFGKNVNLRKCKSGKHIKSDSKKSEVPLCIKYFNTTTQFCMQLYLLKSFVFLLNRSGKANVKMFW